MRILLFGFRGQLGWELCRTLATVGDVTALDFPQVDFARLEELRTITLAAKPDLIVNAVAYTAVDKAESEPQLAQRINAEAPGILAEAARQLRAGLVHVSTDYVLDGLKDSVYDETDPPHPLNVYGQSKLAGEQAVAQVGGAYLTLRTSWVFSDRQGGFVTKVLQWARSQTVLRMVTDQVSSPTWARALAEIIAQLAAVGAASPDLYGWLEERSGLYHLAGSGAASRYEWAEAILACDPHKEEQTVTHLEAALTAEFPTPAVRPLHSVLDCSKFNRTFGLRLPDWRTALQMALES